MLKECVLKEIDLELPFKRIFGARSSNICGQIVSKFRRGN